jgi:hypothetical protein
MKPKLFIINGDEIIGTVYKKDDGNQIVFMRTNKIDLENSLRFLNASGIIIEDKELMDLFKDCVSGGLV